MQGTSLGNPDLLESLARVAILQDRVPRQRQARPWGTTGDGSHCPICQSIVSTQELGFELVFEDRLAHGRPHACLVHTRCFRAWDAARLKLASHAATHDEGDLLVPP